MSGNGARAGSRDSYCWIIQIGVTCTTVTGCNQSGEGTNILEGRFASSGYEQIYYVVVNQAKMVGLANGTTGFRFGAVCGAGKDYALSRLTNVEPMCMAFAFLAMIPHINN